MNEFTDENFPGYTPAELKTLNQALVALDEAEIIADYTVNGITDIQRDKIARERHVQNAEDITNIPAGGPITVVSILTAVRGLCVVRGGTGEHAARALKIVSHT